MSRIFSRADQSVLSQWWWTIDRPLLSALLTLIVYGIVMIVAASPPVAVRIGYDDNHFFYRHMIILAPALITLFGVSMLSPRWIWRLSSLMLVGSILAMCFVLLYGVETKGAQRWLPVFGFSLQPSEFVKPAFAITAAWLISRRKEQFSFPGYRLTTGLYALIVALLLMQPDMGMTFVVSMTIGVQAVLAGLPLVWAFGLGGIGILGLIAAYFGFSHVQSRVDRFLNPESGDTYQIDKSLEAFENGGIFGVGPGQGVVKLKLPDAHADFIFSVAGEELGFLLVGLLVLLFAFVIIRGLSRVLESQDLFIILAVSGLLTSFGLQSLVHMASSLQMMPAKGMTLPFISYGGSSLLATSFAVGAVLALTRRQFRQSIRKSGYFS